MQTIYVREMRQYSIQKDGIDCAWIATTHEGERIYVTAELKSPADVLKGLADVVMTWEALGCPKTELKTMPSGLGRRLAVVVQGRFVRSVEELPD